MSDFGWRMIQVGRRIYVIGGYQDPNRFVELELDSITGDFSQKLRAKMSTPRMLHSVCASPSNKSIYVSGGSSDQASNSREVSRYNVAQDTWTSLP